MFVHYRIKLGANLLLRKSDAYLVSFFQFLSLESIFLRLRKRRLSLLIRYKWSWYDLFSSTLLSLRFA